MRRHSSLLLSLALLGITALLGPAGSQTLSVVGGASRDRDIRAAVGDTLSFQLVAQLGPAGAAGLSFYVRIPAQGFEIVDQGWLPSGETQPFAQGPLFADAVLFQNAEVAMPPGLPDDWRLLAFAAVLGPGGTRTRHGSGVVAEFSLRCLAPAHQVSVTLHSDPVYESRLVLADGRTECPLASGSGVSVTVTVPAEVPDNRTPPTGVATPSWGELKLQARRGR